MAEDAQHSAEGVTGGTQPGGAQAAATQPDVAQLGGGSSEIAPAERRRRRVRRVANWMIILSVVALVGIVLYFVGTWLYAAHAQSALRDELAAENPGLAAAEQSVQPSAFVSAETAAALEAEAARLRQLALLKEAADAYKAENGGHVGRAIGEIVIPAIGVESVMVEGGAESESERYLRKGPGHWPETRFPGQVGSVVVSGHRSTYGAPFRKLDELKPGDEVRVTMPYAVLQYEVSQVIIVKPEEVGKVADRGIEMLSLVACHPLYSAQQRIIAQCKLSSFVLLEAGQ
jgi:LPXTG-site transpeptidase (sortase) family protein